MASLRSGSVVSLNLARQAIFANPFPGCSLGLKSTPFGSGAFSDGKRLPTPFLGLFLVRGAAYGTPGLSNEAVGGRWRTPSVERGSARSCMGLFSALLQVPPRLALTSLRVTRLHRSVPYSQQPCLCAATLQFAKGSNREGRHSPLRPQTVLHHIVDLLCALREQLPRNSMAPLGRVVPEGSHPFRSSAASRSPRIPPTSRLQLACTPPQASHSNAQRRLGANPSELQNPAAMTC